MSMGMFWKILGDACLYFSVTGAFPTVFAHHCSFLWPALLCGAGVGIAALLSEHGKDPWRYGALLLPALSLMLAGTLLEVLLLLPLLIYTAAVVIRGEMGLEYYGYREVFQKTAIGWCVFFLVIQLLAYFETASHTNRSVVDAEAQLLYGVLHLLSGVVLLRQLRLGTEDRGRRLNHVQLICVLGGTGVVLGGVVAAERLLREQTDSLMEYVGRALLGIFTPLMHLLNQVSFDEDYPEATEAVASTQPSTEPLPFTQMMEQYGTSAAEPVTEGEPSFRWWLAVLILAVLQVLLLLFLLNILRAHPAESGTPETLEAAETQEQNKKEPRRTNRAKVRRYYRDFLKAEQKKGLKLRPDQTSADILASISHDTDARSAAQLREVYLSARYDETREVTTEQVKAAKSALKKRK